MTKKEDEKNKDESTNKNEATAVSFTIKARETQGNTLRNKSQKGIILPPYRFEQLIEYVNANTYASRCARQLAESTVGKGYAEGVSDKVKEVFPIQDLFRMMIDFCKTGNGTLEIDRGSNGKGTTPERSYHVPIQTERKYIDKEDQKKYIWVQNYNDKKNKTELAEYNPYNVNTLNIKGNLILHFMNYDSNAEYGLPIWIGGRRKIQTLIVGDDYVYVFFDNDGMPKTILSMIGSPLSKDFEEDLKEMLEGKYANGRGKKGHQGLFVQIPAQFGKFEKIELNKNIVDDQFIKREREDKLDVCNAFSVPPILVGFQYEGKLGASNEVENIMIWYRDDTIEPIRKYLISQMNMVLPDEKIAFNEIYIPKAPDSEQNIDKNARKMIKILRNENANQEED